jgi:phosphosulfolactate phosphohydrolase-like enzyme
MVEKEAEEKRREAVKKYIREIEKNRREIEKNRREQERMKEETRINDLVTSYCISGNSINTIFIASAQLKYE